MFRQPGVVTLVSGFVRPTIWTSPELVKPPFRPQWSVTHGSGVLRLKELVK